MKILNKNTSLFCAFLLSCGSKGNRKKSGDSVQVSGGTKSSPNIKFISSDDHGWGELSYSGNSSKTPNIDRLVKNVSSFDPFEVSPVCSFSEMSGSLG